MSETAVSPSREVDTKHQFETYLIYRLRRMEAGAWLRPPLTGQQKKRLEELDAQLRRWGVL